MFEQRQSANPWRAEHTPPALSWRRPLRRLLAFGERLVHCLCHGLARQLGGIDPARGPGSQRSRDRLWRPIIQPAAPATSVAARVIQPHGNPPSGVGSSGGISAAVEAAVAVGAVSTVAMGSVVAGGSSGAVSTGGAVGSAVGLGSLVAEGFSGCPQSLVSFEMTLVLSCVRAWAHVVRKNRCRSDHSEQCYPQDQKPSPCIAPGP